jgi:hypothetical protein
MLIDVRLARGPQKVFGLTVVSVEVVVEFLQKVTVLKKVVVFHLVFVTVSVMGRGVFVIVLVTGRGVLVVVTVLVTGRGVFVFVVVI